MPIPDRHPITRATTPKLDLVTRFRSACSGGKTFSIFCLIFICWPQLFLFLVHGGGFIKIPKRQCNTNINDLHLLSKSWRRSKVYADYSDRRSGGQIMPETIFDQVRCKTQQHFLHFPIFSRVNGFFFSSKLFIRVSCSSPCT